MNKILKRKSKRKGEGKAKEGDGRGERERGGESRGDEELEGKVIRKK